MQRAVNPSDRRAQAALFEQLESRVVLSSDVGLVGFINDGNGLESFFGDAVLADNNAFSGSYTMEHATDKGDLAEPVNIPWVGLNVNAAGGFYPVWDTDAEPYFSETGGRFLTQPDTMFAGFFKGHSEDFNEFAFYAFVQSPDEVGHTGDLAGNWQASMYRFSGDADVGIAYSGTYSFGGAQGTMLLTTLEGQPVLARSFEITQAGDNGFFSASGGLRMFINRAKNVVIIADVDSTDGDRSISVLTRANPEPTVNTVAGLYRTGTAISLDAISLSGQSPVQSTMLALNANGTYAVVPSERYDTGNTTPVATGTWTLSGSTISIHDSLGSINMIVGANNSTLLSTSITGTAAGSFSIFGLATRVPADLPTPDPIGDLELGLGEITSEGRPLVYEQRDDGEWYLVDLIDETGSDLDPEEVNSIETTTDPVFGKFRAFVNAESGLYMFTRNAGGFWTVENLTDTVTGATPIASKITLFNSLETDDAIESLTHIGGYDETGDLVIYRQTTETEGVEWEFENIATTQLEPNGLTMPALVTDPISYVTSWGGLNIAALDASGAIHSVWWAPGVPNWYTNNLSEITGAAPIAGGLSVYLTSWQGINIAGLDEAGSVLVTWWVPSFGGEWENADLTELAGGPTFTNNTLTAFTASWDGLNLAGIDESGEIVILWWAPANVMPGDSGWRTAPMTEDLPPDDPRPSASLRAFVTDEDQYNVFGASADDELVRLSWSPAEPTWVIENLTEAAN